MMAVDTGKIESIFQKDDCACFLLATGGLGRYLNDAETGFDEVWPAGVAVLSYYSYSLQMR